MELTFDTFTLRPFRNDDYKSFFELLQNNRKRLEKYFPFTVKSTLTIDATRQYVIDRIILADKMEFISFVIVSHDHPGLIGLIFLKNLDWSIPKSEVGFFIDKKFEGEGIISRGVAEVVEYSFRHLKINKLFMRIGDDNPGSQRIAEKNGFILEGKLRNDFKSHDGTLLDVFYYGLTPKDVPGI